MKKDEYLKLRKTQKEIRWMVMQILQMLREQQRTNAIAEQRIAVEEALGFGGPKIPFDDEHYEVEPDGFQTDSEKRNDIDMR